MSSVESRVLPKLAFSGSASRGGAKTLLTSAALLVILLGYTVFFAENVSAWLAILYVGSLMGGFIGWAKLAEPRYSLECDEQGVHYHHRSGRWLLPWHAFNYCAVPSIDGNELAFIGFKVTHYDAILSSIPARLAVRIMTEQRPVYFEAIKQGCTTGECASALLAEKDYFKTAQYEYHGIRAIFARRMQLMGTVSGFELLVPINTSATEAATWCQQINKLRLAQLMSHN